MLETVSAIKKFVLEERKLIGKQLKHTLQTNFVDNSTTPTSEEIRQMLLNEVPRFGNDEDYVDLLVREALNIVTAEFREYRIRWQKNLKSYCKYMGTHSVKGQT